MLDAYVGNISPGFEAWLGAHFDLYKERFLEPNGRVVDRENKNITHSEGMGYSMLIAAAVNDRPAFDLMWGFVSREMLRDDGLVSWVWDPATRPHVRDTNNATDGDMLIATALWAAWTRWGEPGYRASGARIAEAIGRDLIVEYEGSHLILPGKVGFAEPRARSWFWGDDRPSVDRSPKLNQSYWIFFTFPALEALAPDEPWDLVAGEGLKILLTNIHFPTEWSEIKPGEGTVPSPSSASSFSYNAVRIPLYLLHAGIHIASFNQWLLSVWGEPGPGRPFSFTVPGYRRITNMTDPGYRLIHELVWCVETDEPIDIALFRARPTTYFASALQLLSYAAIYSNFPRCVPSIPS